MRLLIVLLLGFSLLLGACGETGVEEKKKVERPVEYDEYGNRILYTADGEREVSGDCEDPEDEDEEPGQ